MKKQPKHQRQNAKAIIALYEGAVARRCSMIDALADLMHYADKHKIDFNNLLRIARDHYETEKGE